LETLLSSSTIKMLTRYDSKGPGYRRIPWYIVTIFFIHAIIVNAGIYMDMSMAVHILGDYFGAGMRDNKGQELEGNNSKIVTELFLSLLREDGLGSDAEIDKIRDKLESSIDIARMESIEDMIDAVVAKFNKNLPFLLLWGYQNLDGGHAMLLEFDPAPTRLPSEKLYKMTVYNTGSGIRYHEICGDCDSFKIQPYVEYDNIELEKLTDRIFLEALLSVSLASKNTKKFLCFKNLLKQYCLQEDPVNLLILYLIRLRCLHLIQYYQNSHNIVTIRCQMLQNLHCDLRKIHFLHHQIHLKYQ
jgi:hypothetical protein